MKARSIASRILLVLLSTLLLAASGTLAWGAVLDYQARGLVPKGVTIVGHDLTGLTEAQARQVIDESVSAPMMRPVTVVGDHKTWTLDPKGIVTVDTEQMLGEAYSPRRNATFAQRINSLVNNEPLPADIKPAYSVDTSAVTSWVASTAAGVNRNPVDAARTLIPNKYKFKFKKEILGARVNQPRAVITLGITLTADTALSSASRVVTLPVYYTTPKVTMASFKTAIVVSISQCKIRLYNGTKLIKTYPCAPGQPAYPTPTGDFHIDSKSRNAPWINPGTPWAKGMPPMIPGGPDNPMGDSKIGINYPGVFMHSIPPGEFGSIGTHASHACMRMFPSDNHDLYKRVKLGDPVFIRD